MPVLLKCLLIALAVWALQQASADAQSDLEVSGPASERLLLALLSDNASAAEGLLLDDPSLAGRNIQGVWPICAAASMSSPHATATLIACDVDLNARDANGRTPLMIAAVFARHETYSLLLKEGADPSLRDLDGKTAQEHLGKGFRSLRSNLFEHVTGRCGRTLV